MKVGEKRRRSQTASWLLAGEDLVLLVERLALQLDPLFGAAEDVLELLQRAQAELALAVELGHVRGALGDLDQADRVAVVVGLAVAVAVGRLVLVGVEGEVPSTPVGERAGEGALGVAVVALAQQRRRRAAAAPGRRASARAAGRRPGRRRRRPASRRSRRRSRRRRGGRRPTATTADQRRRSAAPGRRRRSAKAGDQDQVSGLRISRLKWKPRRSLASSGAVAVRRRCRLGRARAR